MHSGIEDVALDGAFALHGRPDLVNLAHVPSGGIQMAVAAAHEAGHLGGWERQQRRVYGGRFNAVHRAAVARAHYQMAGRVEGQSVDHVLGVTPDAAGTGHLVVGAGNRGSVYRIESPTVY